MLDELEYPEIARGLRCSEAVVRQRVSRGMRALRADAERRGLGR
jgi:RNA polymerase sigma-70 factor (ECF subfamily)